MKSTPLFPLVGFSALFLAHTGCGDAPPADPNPSPKLFPVQPVSSGSTPSVSRELHVGQGRFFSYALPQGWRVGEDGQFALTLVAPDSKALTLMVGNAGLPLNYPPERFVQDKLMALGPQNLQISQPKTSTPITGFNRAYQFEVTYEIQGAPCRGLVKCHVATAYDMSVMAMTAALSDATQWSGYSNWLPLVADQIAATDGAAFGSRGIMQQNLKNSASFAEAARQYRDWSQRNWQQVTDERNASVDRRNSEFRENLGAVQTYLNPYNEGVTLELPTRYQFYWMDRQGNILGTDDPGANPNVGSTGEWLQLGRYRP